MYRLFIIGLLCCAAVAQGQVKLQPADFAGTAWVTGNKDSTFFKSDTVRLIKSITSKTEEIDAPGHFNGSDFVTLTFAKAHKLQLAITEVATWSVIQKKGPYKWVFHPEKQLLTLYFKDTLFASFTPLRIQATQVKSIYADHGPVATKELILVRVQ
ncbi:hypothetical protein [Chitinophaga nivalis]|uniref:Lipocalin-like domain-containing protein n=1 Tax=Chitinophaga nivalis TaxID=2991709 RepID=A0ABT3IEH9_9BACT|nr:hypothetical protein [Chitinophaga nivalis]MCW3467950.1 hypothetical protein [Chitinophaga nivalis]MCW3482359.1 hypothetical protein [Chitinophaga nivalis]